MEFMPPLNPELPDGQYQDGDPATSVVGSIPPAEAIEHPMREIVHVIEQELGELAPTKNDLTQLHQAIQAMIDGGIGGSSFTGMIGHFASTTAPSGWLKADGSYVDKDTYSALHGIVGTTYGPLVGNTFKLPDLRGEFIRGLDDGRGIDAGRDLQTAQPDQLASHSHIVKTSEIAGSDPDTIDGDGSNPSGGGGALRNVNTSSTGEMETRPRNIAMLACIKI